MTTQYPKRLIEVDLPIKAISAHARREKSIRHGHISTLHIWWARRPLAACRAVLCASLWPDPADEHCPQAFRDVAAKILCEFAEKVRTDKQLAELCQDHWTRWRSTDASRLRAADPATWWDMRHALLDFIADFANWDSSSVPAFLEAARGLTAAAHSASASGAGGTPPLVVDPFAGGGSIPLEALRIGAEAFASDLNPVAVLLNKVALEYVPKHGRALLDAFRRWSSWVSDEAKRRLSPYFPVETGRTPIAYLWARQVRCEGPGCGADIPLIRSLWLAKKGRRSVAIAFHKTKDRAIGFRILEGPAARDVGPGTVVRGSATCPVCGYTTPVQRVRAQLYERHGGASDAMLFCVVETAKDGTTLYRLPNKGDTEAATRARSKVTRLPAGTVPDEPLPPDGTLGFRVQKYGLRTWGELFSPRQRLVLTTFADLAQEAGASATRELGDEVGAAVATLLSLAIGKLADFESSLCSWRNVRTCVRSTFARAALPITWDFGEMYPFAGSAGDWSEACRYIALFVEQTMKGISTVGEVRLASATGNPLASESAAVFATDPPYYDAVPYAAMSDFFYVWHRRALASLHPSLFGEQTTPKRGECIVDPANGLDRKHFETTMARAMAEGRRVLASDGIGVLVFAHKSTAGWESQLQAMLAAGWTVTASWPIDTERPGRLRANDSAALASSVHIVCRPRGNSQRTTSPPGPDDVGSWRAILSELPGRIHEWMPRLAQEGVVGADAIFACLGPALEIFSRYSRVEKASGEAVTLKEYLEQVWAAVSKEALSMVFKEADASGLEEDARLTAMWLWTLAAKSNGGGKQTSSDGDAGDADEPDDDDDDDESAAKGPTGLILEFDAARKIAQGLGAHIEQLAHVVEVKGDKARLLSVGERAKYLFAKDEADERGKGKSVPKKKKQLGLFAEIEAAEREGLLGKAGVPRAGATALDRVHQAMLLFGAGRAEAMKRFIVDEGAGNDSRFWQLAQSLSALYPSSSGEKRWVDGVLARKKALGF